MTEEEFVAELNRQHAIVDAAIRELQEYLNAEKVLVSIRIQVFQQDLNYMVSAASGNPK